MMKMILVLIKKAILSFVMDNKEEIKAMLWLLLKKIAKEAIESKKA